MGVAIGWDGGALFESEPFACYVRGVYARSGPEEIDHLVLVPCWGRLRYGTPARLLAYRRRLDLRHGLLDTLFTLEEARGVVEIAQRVFVSRADPHRAAVRLTICPHFDGALAILTGLAVSGNEDLEVIELGARDATLRLRGHVPSRDIELAEVLSLEGEGWTATDDKVGRCEVTRTMTAHGKAHAEITLVQMASISTSLESPEPPVVARIDPRERRADPRSSGPPPHPEGPSYAGCEDDHRRAWKDLWATDIEIDGDPEAQQFARAALFYLWGTVGEGDRWSIAPMGLSSNFYNGHIFWDAELWMFPSLLVTHPALAGACVAYREHSLDAARKRAAASGRRGAQFPWEGGFAGEEMTPRWAQTRDYQLHITADVALAHWWFYLITRDERWLREHGFPVMRECAEFWSSRVEYNAGCDRYEVSDVVCADEYAEHVDNDAFTNAAVQQALRVTTRAAELLGEPAPDEWRTIADRMYIPFDPERRIHPEYDGYDDRVTKQADVELLAYPLESTDDPEQVGRDLDFYRGVVDPNGPAMSFSVYSILSAQLGREADAYEYFRRSFIPNTRPPFWAFSETPTNDEYVFCTGLGGALQALLFGFTGLRLREGYFVLRPLLPERWTALRLRNLFIAGARTDLVIERGRLQVVRRVAGEEVGLTVIRHAGGEAVIESVDGGEDLHLEVATAAGDMVRCLPVGEACVELPGLAEGVRLRLVGDAESLLDVLLLRVP
jgi:trehalose/maltose hydrolase-like predicted phosphorylase